MATKIAFIGHRNIPFLWNKRDELYNLLEKEIKKGCKSFTMGVHGDFDNFALGICRELRRKYNDINIEVVITALSQIKPIVEHDAYYGDEVYKPYEDVKTVLYDIEEVYYKKRITESNKQMIDSCDMLICYVKPNYKYKSGAKTAMNYAKKKGLQIVNLCK